MNHAPITAPMSEQEKQQQLASLRAMSARVQAEGELARARLLVAKRRAAFSNLSTNGDAPSNDKRRSTIAIAEALRLADREVADTAAVLGQLHRRIVELEAVRTARVTLHCVHGLMAQPAFVHQMLEDATFRRRLAKSILLDDTQARARFDTLSKLDAYLEQSARADVHNRSPRTVRVALSERR